MFLCNISDNSPTITVCIHLIRAVELLVFRETRFNCWAVSRVSPAGPSIVLLCGNLSSCLSVLIKSSDCRCYLKTDTSSESLWWCEGAYAGLQQRQQAGSSAVNRQHKILDCIILNTLFCVLNVPGGSWPGCAALIFVLSVCLWCGASSWSLIITTTSDFLWHDLLNAALPWRLSGRVQVQISCKTSRESGKSTVCEPSCSHTEHRTVRWVQPQIYHQSSQEFVENGLLTPLRQTTACAWFLLLELQQFIHQSTVWLISTWLDKSDWRISFSIKE